MIDKNKALAAKEWIFKYDENAQRLILQNIMLIMAE